jgi:hypothetical protein
MTYISLFPENLAELLDQHDLYHPEPARLAEYISLMSYSTTERTVDEIIEENIAKWVDDEQECYYGTYSSPAEFAEEYYHNYATEGRIPDWVVVDWQATWDCNLHHDFYYSSDGYVWAEIY